MPSRWAGLGALAVVLLVAPRAAGRHTASAVPPARPFRAWRSVRQRLPCQAAPRPSSMNCTWVYVRQPLSHFTRGATGDGTFQQRLCINDAYWDGAAVGAPIFFYVGNESPLDEYVNNTGLMWEAAREFKALLVWAEHRYFGDSMPALKEIPNCLAWLSSQEALADYATLLETFRNDNAWKWHAPQSPVIAFGGSYGGMLAAWIRMKYPNLVAGSIAASAPIWGFPHSAGNFDGSAVQLTKAAMSAGGAPAACVPNLKAAWVLIGDMGKTAEGLQLISKAMGLCKPLVTAEDAGTLLQFLQDPLFNLAEGSYPFETDYITYATYNSTTSPLPKWPMVQVCAPLAGDFGVSLHGDVEAVRFEVHAGTATISVDWDRTEGNGYNARALERTGVPHLLAALVKGLQVWYNVTGASHCLDWSRPGHGAEHPDARADIAAAGGPSTTSGSTVEAPAPMCRKATLTAMDAWDALVCNDGMNLVTTAVRGFGQDLYWPPSHPRNVTMAEVVEGSLTYCHGFKGRGYYGLPEKPDEWATWMDITYGGRRITAHENIFFSNGDLDPWAAGGVLAPGHLPGLPAVTIARGGHHLDLFFPTADDPLSVQATRATELSLIATWLMRESRGGNGGLNVYV